MHLHLLLLMASNKDPSATLEKYLFHHYDLSSEGLISLILKRAMSLLSFKNTSDFIEVKFNICIYQLVKNKNHLLVRKMKMGVEQKIPEQVHQTLDFYFVHWLWVQAFHLEQGCQEVTRIKGERGLRSVDGKGLRD